MNIFVKSVIVKEKKVKYQRTAEKKRHQIIASKESLKSFEMHRTKNEK